VKIETLIENISDAILVVDHDWMIVNVNHRAELLVRQRRDELVGRSYWEVFPETLGTPAEVELRRTMDDRSVVDFEQFVPSIYAWHQVRSVPTSDGLYLVFRDITDRMRMMRDEAVRAAVREILEHVPISISVMRGPEHRIEMVNALARRSLAGREIEGMPIRSAVPELDGQGYFELLDQVYQTGQPYEGRELKVVYELSPETGPVTAYLNVIYQPIFETNGQVAGLITLSVDVTDLVTERQRHARQARERDAVLQQLVEGVIITDAEGRITFVNDAAARLHGVARLDVGPEDYTETYNLLTLDGQPFPSEELPLARAVGGETVVDAGWRIRRPDGSEVDVIGNAQPIHDAEGRQIAAVLTIRREDATAREGV
jgi:PAS domain S-box-containing protein